LLISKIDSFPVGALEHVKKRLSSLIHIVGFLLAEWWWRRRILIHVVCQQAVAEVILRCSAELSYRAVNEERCQNKEPVAGGMGVLNKALQGRC